MAVGTIVVSGDEVDPVLARVVAITERPSGTKVHLALLPGDPAEYARLWHGLTYCLHKERESTSLVLVLAETGRIRGEQTDRSPRA